MPQIDNLQTVPLDSFSLAWRWIGPDCQELPEDALSTIRCLDEQSARNLSPLLKKANPAPGAISKDYVTAARVSTSSRPALVTTWLHDRMVADDVVVAVSWDDVTAVVLPWRTFAAHWQAFCYPSSDDVTVIPADEAWLLVYAHYEEMLFATRVRLGVV